MEYICKLVSSTATSEFCEQGQVGFNAYIHSRLRPIPLNGFHLLLLFPQFIGITSFVLHQHNKYSVNKMKLRQASNICKTVTEAGKLAYTNETKSVLLPTN